MDNISQFCTNSYNIFPYGMITINWTVTKTMKCLGLSIVKTFVPFGTCSELTFNFLSVIKCLKMVSI